jgi:hypothetical protein
VANVARGNSSRGNGSRPSRRPVELEIVDERSKRISERLEMPILIAALLVIPVIVIEESNVSDAWKKFGTILNWTIWLVFAAEVVVMLTVVPSKRRWRGPKLLPLPPEPHPLQASPASHSHLPPKTVWLGLIQSFL